MSCFHPLIRQPKVEYIQGIGNRICTTSTGEVIYSIRKLLPYEMEHMINGDYGFLNSESVLIPCGHCVGCKLDYSREWADRMLMELQTADGKGLFVTLTYDQDNVPKSKYVDNEGKEHCNYTLMKKDFQDWLKRLRRYFDGSGAYDYPKREIRYYGAGEYGEMTLRPHGHFILFGLSLDDVGAIPALTPLGDSVTNRNGDPYYDSAILSKSWPYGHVSVAKVTWRSCAYVARYVTKKWSSGYGDSSKGDLYKLFGVQPEFSLMSRKPGIGSRFFDDWHRDHAGEMMFEYSAVSAVSSGDGQKLRVPKYFKSKFKTSTDVNVRQRYEECCKAAGVRAENRTALKLDKTDLDYLAMLEGEENHLKNETKILKRNKV